MFLLKYISFNELHSSHCIHVENSERANNVHHHWRSVTITTQSGGHWQDPWHDLITLWYAGTKLPGTCACSYPQQTTKVSAHWVQDGEGAVLMDHFAEVQDTDSHKGSVHNSCTKCVNVGEEIMLKNTSASFSHASCCYVENNTPYACLFGSAALLLHLIHQGVVLKTVRAVTKVTATQ